MLQCIFGLADTLRDLELKFYIFPNFKAPNKLAPNKPSFSVIVSTHRQTARHTFPGAVASFLDSHTVDLSSIPVRLVATSLW